MTVAKRGATSSGKTKAGVLLALVLPMAQAAGTKVAALADLSLEELGRIEVTSVSRRAERLSDAAASIFVITSESIRRSGATTLPEALRLAPNLQVTRLNASQYAISARGFNNAIGNKLLVLIDGRTVYAPFFSGVFWDQQDVMLEDVERIEVISGPGATLWGANAVNGVINVITRSSADTQGGLVVLEGGNRERGAAFRYGGALGADGHFRLFAKTAKADHTSTAAGARVADGQERTHLGWRADWGEAAHGFTLQGDAYSAKTDDRGSLGPFRLGPIEVSGANLLARLTRRLDDGSDFRVQAYYDHTDRIDAFAFQPKERIFDIEFQHGLQLKAHRILWGGGYRQDRDDIRTGSFFGFVPPARTTRWKNLFIQDEFALGEHLNLVLGAKLESNPFTGTESLPSARLEWKLSERSMVWSS
ncbi:MAG TPA: TonB-dependent receptor, partial [Burkholderiaceae bacterium]|nr:TonB-dependent receptor [Burkholderiaceae bacterium]